MSLSTRYFKLEQPRRPLNWGDVVVILVITVLIYLGARLAVAAPMAREVVQTALELEFPPDLAEEQVETLINWGRYAEILAYDDGSEMLYLEPSSAPVPTLAE